MEGNLERRPEWYTFLKDNLLDALPGILFFAAVLSATLFLQPGFITRFYRTLAYRMPLAFLAMGQIFVLTTADIDLSAGAGLSLVNVVTVSLYVNYGIASPLILIIPLGVGLAIGIINGLLVGYLRLNAFLATIGTTSVWTGTALFIMGRPGGAVPAWFTSMFQGGVLGVPLSFWLIVLVIGIWFIFRYLSVSNYLYATGSDIEAAFSTGVDANRMKFYAFLLNGLMIGLAGLVMTGSISSGDPRIGEGLVLAAIIAALIGGGNFSGGSGNAIGAAAAGLGLGFMRNLMFFLGISSFNQNVVRGSIILIIVIVLSYGKLKDIEMKDIGLWGEEDGE